MIRSNLLIVLTACAVAGASGLAGCAGAASDTAGSAAPVEQGSSSASTKDGAKDDAASTPLTAADLHDGDYDITVTSSSRMFNVKKAVLHVTDGSMTCTMTLGGTGYGKLFMGTGDEAASAAEDQFIPFVENAEGAYEYTVPVQALDEETDCAAWSIRKESWYDRTLVFESADLPSSAYKA